MNRNKEKMGAESISRLMLLYMENEKIGYVHSIFKDSLNIKFGENLVYISGLKRKLVSFGCRISDDKIEKIIRKSGKGNIVVHRCGEMVFYTNGGVEILNLPLNKIEELHIPYISSIKCRQKIFKNIMENIEDIDLKNKSGLGNIKNELEEKFSNGLTEELQKYLTGRGKGLTPSGDDLLIGYSFICRLCGENIVLQHGNSTTDISRQYFDAFNRGYVSEDILDLLRKDIGKAVKDMTEIGHTSGYDTLLGIVLGIRGKYQKWRK